jgi:hypothetical protein
MTDDQTSQERLRSETDASSAPASPDITRREWLLRLGGSAVLMGFQGVPAAGQSGTAPPGTDQLPPGLYDPSEDHMTHALMSDKRFYPTPAGSATDFLRPPSGPFQPQFFSPADFQAVKHLVATILGESVGSSEMGITVLEIAEWIDLEVFNSAAVRQAALNLSPQHRALAIAYHGERAVTGLETHDPQKIWRGGLDWISAESRRRWGKAFIDAPQASQAEILKSLSGLREADNAGTRLFVLLKNQVAHGFYTSQPGLKELDYKGNTFYAECPGCNPSKRGPK